MRRLCYLLAVFGLTLAMGPLAFGDTIFDLTVDQHGLSTPPANAVKVDVHLSGGVATVTFTALAPGGTQYYMDNVFLNVEATGFTSLVGATGTSSPTQTYHVADTGGLDSFGQMTYEVTPNSGHPSTQIVVTLDGTWASDSSVLTPTCPDNESTFCAGGGGYLNGLHTGYNPFYYPQGFDAAANIGTSSSSDQSDEGPIAGTVPEPASLALLGSGLLALAGAARRKLFR